MSVRRSTASVKRGFRSGRSAHDALDALATGIYDRKVNWVIDADIRDFFRPPRHPVRPGRGPPLPSPPPRPWISRLNQQIFFAVDKLTDQANCV